MTTTTLIRRSLALPMLMMAALGTTACSGGLPGTATPTTSTSSEAPSSPAGNPLASVQPCSLLAQGELTGLGMDQGKPDNTSKSRGCQWNKGTSYTLSIYLDGSQAIEAAGSDGAIKVTLQSHDAVQTAPNGFGCGVEIAISKTSSVDVDITPGADDCQLAQQFAGLIEPRLPAQQK